MFWAVIIILIIIGVSYKMYCKVECSNTTNNNDNAKIISLKDAVTINEERAKDYWNHDELVILNYFELKRPNNSTVKLITTNKYLQIADEKIAWQNIISAQIQTTTEIQQKISASKLALFGIFALASKSNETITKVYLCIEYKKPYGQTETDLFSNSSLSTIYQASNNINEVRYKVLGLKDDYYELKED